jgi:xanthine dehydrogenase accessory factor
MKELREILNCVGQLAPDERAILATVVDVKGSGYRLAGARMLIDENGYSIGSVSGGCLESDVLERAKDVLKTGEAAIVTYDSTRDENSVFGLQMGCRGVVRILLEPANDERLFSFLDATFAERRTSAITTLIAAKERNIFDLGHRFYWRQGFQDATDFDGFPDEILPVLTRDIGDSISERRSRTKTYSTQSGELEFFIEVIEPPPLTLIFGGGHDAIPLAAFAKQLGWLVSVIDRRPAYATAERFPEADNVIVGHAEDLDDAIFADENSVAVTMTHHFESDREVVRRLASSRCRYIGILGPKQRTADLLKELSDSGTVIDSAVLERIHAPVGLDIGAATPESIALSIIAEIQAFLSRRDGGHLKDRKQPIYDR